MTNSTTPGYPGSSDASLGASTQTGTAGSTYTSTNPTNETGDAGRVAGVAKDETKAVGNEARRQARRLADEVGSEVRQQAAHQQSRAAGGLRNLGDEFSSMADGSGSGSGFAADIAREAGQRVGAVAQWLDERDPRDLLVEVKGFARRRPGVFLAIAVGTGVVVGRLTRALMTPDDDDDRASAASGRPVSTYGTGTTGTTGVTGVTGSETVVTGTATGLPVDPATGQSWPEGTPATTRGGF